MVRGSFVVSIDQGIAHDPGSIVSNACRVSIFRPRVPASHSYVAANAPLIALSKLLLGQVGDHGLSVLVALAVLDDGVPILGNNEVGKLKDFTHISFLSEIETSMAPVKLCIQGPDLSRRAGTWIRGREW